MAIKTLSSSELRLSTDDSLINVSSSDELTPAKPCTGQDRAVAALQTALAVPGPGYHVMVIGKQGTERFNCLTSVLDDFASADVTIENPDRVLLPVKGRVSQYEEVLLQNGRARKLIDVCQQVVMATVNNDAEYQALIFALKKVKLLVGKQKAKSAKLNCFLDSELIVKQLNHQYKINAENTQRYFIEVWNLMLDYGELSFTHIRREQNKVADSLVNKALDDESDQVALF